MDHHYVPQFYLRQWAGANGRVLRYKRSPKGGLLLDPVAPKGTAFEPDLYAAPPAMNWEHHDPNVIETQVMSPIDSAAALVLSKLVGDGPQLDEAERTSWARFLLSLLYRHRDAILERDRYAPTLAADTLARFLARYEGQDRLRAEEALDDVDLDQAAMTAHRTVMVQAIRDPKAVAAVKGLAWDVLTLDARSPFITTDRPLLVNLGQGGVIQLMSLPLSPTHLFFAYPSPWREADGTVIDGAAELRENLAAFHNLFLLNEQPCRYVYAARPIDDNQIVRNKIVRLHTAVHQVLVP